MARLLAHHAFILVAIVLLALNLRPTAVSVGPVLAEIQAGLHLSTTTAGVLTSLPVLAFAAVGALTPATAQRFGIHRVTLCCLLLVALGLMVRSMAADGWAFLAWSFVALSGMAGANVLLPSLVKLHFPHRVGAVTAAYTTSLAVGLTAALTLTVPLLNVTGGWRAALAVWGVLAVVAMVPWALLVGRDRSEGRPPEGVSLADVARTPLGWAMAVLFGLQSTQAYVVFGWFAQLWRDSGYSPTVAGALVGIIAAVSIPLSWLISTVASRTRAQTGLVLALMACFPVGYVGLLLAPHRFAVLWALIVGAGLCMFPLVLVLIGLRSRTAEATAALSGFTQSMGYLIAAAGPVTVGAIYEATGGWTWNLLLLVILAVPMLFTALYAARPRYVEDQLQVEDQLR